MCEESRKSMREIIPAILPKSTDDLKEKVLTLPQEITFFHFDVLEEDIWTEIDKEFEVHLMVKEPEKIIEKWVKRGAKRIIAHELTHELITELNKFEGRIEVGLEIEMQEFLDKEFEQVPLANFIHIMSIDEIGEQGHPFNPQVFDRIREVRKQFRNLEISVDGGISIENYKELFDAGANRLIVGSHFTELWNSLMKK